MLSNQPPTNLEQSINETLNETAIIPSQPIENLEVLINNNLPCQNLETSNDSILETISRQEKEILSSLEVGHLLKAYIYRNNLTKSATNGLLHLLFALRDGSGFENLPSSIDPLVRLKDNDTNNSKYFCACHNVFFDQSSFCNTCNSYPKNCLFINDAAKSFFEIYDRNENLKSQNYPIDLAFHTDGISIFSKSSFSIWPFYFVFCDLPYNERYLLKNIIILGIWYGATKPQMNSVLKYLFDPYFRNNTVVFTRPNLSCQINIKFFIADKPARSSVLGMQSCNSKYFCPVCLAQTEVIVEDTRNKHIICDFNQDMTKRTNAGFSSCAYSAFSTNKPDYGIKSLSFFLNISNLDIVKFNIFDYMHGVCLGIFKDLFNYIFFSSTNSQKYFKSIEPFEVIIKNFKYSANIASPVPLIKKNKLWKAKDYKNFFLHIMPVTLHYLENVELRDCIINLREGIYILLCNDACLHVDQVKIKFSSFLF